MKLRSAIIREFKYYIAQTDQALERVKDYLFRRPTNNIRSRQELKNSKQHEYAPQENMPTFVQKG